MGRDEVNRDLPDADVDALIDQAGSAAAKMAAALGALKQSTSRVKQLRAGGAVEGETIGEGSGGTTKSQAISPIEKSPQEELIEGEPALEG